MLYHSELQPVSFGLPSLDKRILNLSILINIIYCCSLQGIYVSMDKLGLKIENKKTLNGVLEI